MQDELLRQFNRQLDGCDLPQIVALLRTSCNDYNADKQRPLPGSYVQGGAKSGSYLRRLEDIDESWVRRYLSNSLVGLKINARGGIREIRSQFGGTRILCNEEGEETEEGALLTEQHRTSPLEISEAIQKLPYLLKRLHDKSVLMSVSALSLIIAYEHIRRRGEIPKPGRLLAEGVCRMNRDGYIVGYFPATANTGKVFPPASRWILGEERDAWFYDAMELLRVCDVLHIDITQEDPYDWQAPDIARLKVTYITKNRDYLAGGRQRNLSVLDSLSNARVSDYTKAQSPMLPVATMGEALMHRLLVSRSSSVYELLQARPAIGEVNEFLRNYARKHPEIRVSMAQRMDSYGLRGDTSKERTLAPILGDFPTDQGFCLSMSGGSAPQVFEVTGFVEGEYSRLFAILHGAGYLFLIEDSLQQRYVALEDYNAYVRDAALSQFDNHYSNGHKFGAWSVCLV